MRVFSGAVSILWILTSSALFASQQPADSFSPAKREIIQKIESLWPELPYISEYEPSTGIQQQCANPAAADMLETLERNLDLLTEDEAANLYTFIEFYIRTSDYSLFNNTLVDIAGNRFQLSYDDETRKVVTVKIKSQREVRFELATAQAVKHADSQSVGHFPYCCEITSEDLASITEGELAVYRNWRVEFTFKVEAQQSDNS